VVADAAEAQVTRNEAPIKAPTRPTTISMMAPKPGPFMSLPVSQHCHTSLGPEIGESGENQSLNNGKNHCGRNTKHECTIDCFQRP
jgi:hypothetical protein